MAKSPAQEPPPGPIHSNHTPPCSALSPGPHQSPSGSSWGDVEGRSRPPQGLWKQVDPHLQLPLGKETRPWSLASLFTQPTYPNCLLCAGYLQHQTEETGLHGEAQHPAGLSPLPHWPGTWGVPGGQGSRSGQLPGDGDVRWISLCQAGKIRGHSSLRMVDTVVEGQRVWVGHRGSEGFQTGNHSTCHPSARALFAAAVTSGPIL